MHLKSGTQTPNRCKKMTTTKRTKHSKGEADKETACQANIMPVDLKFQGGDSEGHSQQENHNHEGNIADRLRETLLLHTNSIFEDSPTEEKLEENLSEAPKAAKTFTNQVENSTMCKQERQTCGGSAEGRAVDQKENVFVCK